MDVERLKNPRWMESDGQRLILDPQETPQAMLEAATEIDRLRGILRSCHGGPDFVDLGNGETLALYLPNKDLK